MTYSEAVNGAKVEKTVDLKFPAEGCIGVSGAACPGDAPAAGPVRAGVAGPDHSDDVPTKTESEDGETGDEEDPTQMHNALLGTATGIVIFAIIVILIWFIRKKNRESEEPADDGYKVTFFAIQF